MMQWHQWHTQHTAHAMGAAISLSLKQRGLADGLHGVMGSQLHRLGGGCLILTHTAAIGKALT